MPPLSLPVVPDGDPAGSREPEALPHVERCAAGEPLHDYVLGRYEPPAPEAGKLRSLVLLHAALREAGALEGGLALVDAIRGALGPFRTIWGVKHDAASGRIRGVELYFYDWKRTRVDLSLARLREAFAPIVALDAHDDRPIPWHMVSVDVPVSALRRPGTEAVPAHVYVDMRSYELRGAGWTFENVYTFHDPRAEVDDVLARLRGSVHLPPRLEGLSALIPPALFRCHRLCVANKRLGDALYFSRVSTPALLGFLEARGYPGPLARAAREHAGELDHLLWDVGVDFSLEGGAPVVRRSGFYGSF